MKLNFIDHALHSVAEALSAGRVNFFCLLAYPDGRDVLWEAKITETRVVASGIVYRDDL